MTASPRFADFQQQVYAAGASGELPGLPMTPAGMEELARSRMTERDYSYVAGAAGTESTARSNLAAFDRWQIVPRHLRSAPERDLTTQLFGQRVPTPILLAPVGALSTVHPQAELVAAEVAATMGIPVILSTLSGSSLEEVAAVWHQVGAGVGWFQLYWPTDREVAQSLVKRAERAGYGALVLTVDTWTLAWRPRDLALGHLPFLNGQGLANYLTDPCFRSRLEVPPEQDPAAAISLWARIFNNPGLSWDDLKWLREQTRLPILLKGICHPDDARQAFALGADGVIVSNHGGRQIDGARPALDCLPEVVDAVPGQMVLFDSGIRGGSDVVKALALGATAVLLGRPFVFGLAAAGADGLRHVLRCLLADLDLTLGLSGHASISDLGRDCLVRAAGI